MSALGVLFLMVMDTSSLQPGAFSLMMVQYLIPDFFLDFLLELTWGGVKNPFYFQSGFQNYIMWC